MRQEVPRARSSGLLQSSAMLAVPPKVVMAAAEASLSVMPSAMPEMRSPGTTRSSKAGALRTTVGFCTCARTQLLGAAKENPEPPGSRPTWTPTTSTRRFTTGLPLPPLKVAAAYWMKPSRPRVALMIPRVTLGLAAVEADHRPRVGGALSVDGHLPGASHHMGGRRQVTAIRDVEAAAEAAGRLDDDDDGLHPLDHRRVRRRGARGAGSQARDQQGQGHETKVSGLIAPTPGERFVSRLLSPDCGFIHEGGAPGAWRSGLDPLMKFPGGPLAPWCERPRAGAGRGPGGPASPCRGRSAWEALHWP